MEVRSGIRKTLKLLLSLICLKISHSLIKKWQEWQLTYKKAFRLPSIPIPKEAEGTVDAMGTLVRGLPKGEPLNSASMFKHFVDIFFKIATEQKKKHGLVCFWFVNPKVVPLPLYQVIILDYDLIKQLNAASMQPYLKKSKTYTFLEDLIGKSMVVESGEIWHNQRIVADKGFSGNQIKHYTKIVEKCCLKFKTKISNFQKKGILVDVCDEMIKLVMDMLGEIVFSIDFECLEDIKTEKHYLYEANESITETLKYWVRNPLFYPARYIPIMNRKYWKYVKGYNKSIQAIIKQRKKRFEENMSAEPENLADFLIKATVSPVQNLSTGKYVKMTEKEVIDNIKLILFAGHDTTAISTAWGLYLLAKHPEIAENLYKELTEEGKPGELMDCIIIEVLRMYPPGMFFKEPIVDIQLGQYSIPKGSEIMLNPFLIQRDDRYYKNPHVFDPSRWKEYVSLGKPLSLTMLKISKDLPFFTFSLGARNCVGKGLALIEMKMIFKTIITNFKLSLPSQMPKDFQEFPYMGLTMIPKGCQVIFEDR